MKMPPHSVSSAPYCAWLNRLLFPSWTQRKRLLRKEAWIFVVACWILLGFAWIWPDDFQNESVAFVLGATIAFMTRTFVFHFGLILLVIMLVSAYMRSWRLLAAVIPPALFTLGPTVWEFRPRADRTITEDAIMVMSVNLLALNKVSSATYRRNPQRPIYQVPSSPSSDSGCYRHLTSIV
ncbi:MAG: hypothetical protein GXY44_04125 [Phycisphaerales bacterium]|nr:hypothetical protein [Phycisphaerales bacterium]